MHPAALTSARRQNYYKKRETRSFQRKKQRQRHTHIHTPRREADTPKETLLKNTIFLSAIRRRNNNKMRLDVAHTKLSCLPALLNPPFASQPRRRLWGMLHQSWGRVRNVARGAGPEFDPSA